MNKLLDELVSQDPEKVSTFKLTRVRFSLGAQPFFTVHAFRSFFLSQRGRVAGADQPVRGVWRHHGRLQLRGEPLLF